MMPSYTKVSLNS